jgi:hypothetical protein
LTGAESVSSFGVWQVSFGGGGPGRSKPSLKMSSGGGASWPNAGSVGETIAASKIAETTRRVRRWGARTGTMRRPATLTMATGERDVALIGRLVLCDDHCTKRHATHIIQVVFFFPLLRSTVALASSSGGTAMGKGSGSFFKRRKNEPAPFSPYESVSHARESLARFIAFYNTRRPHSSPDGKTPDEVYFATQADARLAA